MLGTGGSKGSKGLGEADSAAAARALSETPDGLLELLGETVYGGRMADASDRRALRTLLADCFAPGPLV